MRRRLRQLLRGPRALLIAAATLALFLLAALGADLLASSLPLACRIGDRLHLLPALTRPAELVGEDNQSLARKAAAAGGFVLAPPVAYGPLESRADGRLTILAAPSLDHPLGTDDVGRDVLARLIHAGRAAFAVGLGSMAIAALIGVLLGALGAYFGGLADRINLRLIEAASSFPALVLVLAVQGLAGATSLFQLTLIIALTRFPDIARITRGEVLRVGNEDFVGAARALGLGHLAILRRHVLPHARGPVLVACFTGIADAILIEATLSFLGFGAPPPTPTFGQLVTDAFLVEGRFWLVLFPALALLVTVTCINLVGEGLREALDPGPGRR